MKIIKIGTECCGPCKMQNKELDKLTDVEVVKIDADEDEDAVSKYNVRSIPVVIAMDNDNNEIKRWNGLTKANVIQSFIDENK